MTSMEDVFEAACKAKTIPGAVLVATSRTGSFQYAKSFGVRSLEEGTEQPLEQDAIMQIASCTKLFTSIAALQCVERGQLKLDEDVSKVLPELKDINIITGFDESTGKPTLKKPSHPVTLRMLLSHSSGSAYDVLSPDLMKWHEIRGEKPQTGGTVVDRFFYPLTFEPGTSWMYGAGIDWAGKMVEHVNQDMSLQTYMEKYIWQPLGIKDISFFPTTRSDLAARMVKMSVRGEDGQATVDNGPQLTDGAEDCFGGHGAYACAADYLKVMHSLLADDEKLLKKETMSDIFKPQLTDLSQSALMKVTEIPALNNVFGALPVGTNKDWGLAGMLCLDNLPDWRRKGTLTWGGMPNLTWFIDREAGLCGLYASQILPPDDQKSKEMSQLFERAMYERAAACT